MIAGLTDGQTGDGKSDILGISELRWTGMGEFNSDDHCVYYCGRNPSEEMSSHHGQQKSPKCSTWMQSQK